MENCIFCSIINKELPARIIYEDEHYIAFLDVNPIVKGHTLVIPKAHYTNLFDIDEDVYANLSRVVQKVSIALKDYLNADGINIINNNGASANQVVFHYHTHIIPRYDNDNPLFKHAPIPIDLDALFLEIGPIE
ncbi:MAG: HIT family protein [Bacilli bacterium]